MKYTEVRWHGRAQQGMVTAAKLLGEAALMEGKYVQAFPEFGPERMGAPVRAFNRVSDDPIKMHCQVTNPNIVLIADQTLIGMALSGGMESFGSVTSGTEKDGIFIVNTPNSPEVMRKMLSLAEGFGRVYTLDASKISRETIKREMPNTPMLGAVAKVTGLIKLESLIEDFKENYAKKYSAQVIEGNVAAMKAGFEGVKGEK
ncbi:MAG: 2-oxoacid:acceptor oxidoreductase family protein [Deltaproteobacteria bacterium]|mgnify:FL=1